MRITDLEANRLRVLKSIRRSEPIARIALAECTGLPTQTISDLVADLLACGLLVEEKAASGKRGRPRRDLRLDPRAGRVIGAFLFPGGRLGIDIADVRGESLFGCTADLPATATLPDLAQAIAAALQAALDASPFAAADIDRIGIGLPAVVNSLAGVVHWLPGYPAGDVPLAGLVAGHLGVPTSIDSTADVLTRAEHWFGADRQVDDFALIFVGYGLGLGQYVDGLLRTGDHGISPAFAHVKVMPAEGPVCHCGARGCLTTYASISGIVGQVCAQRGSGSPGLHAMQAMLHDFAEQARSGDAEIGKTFDFAGLALGVAAANIINIGVPARLVILFQDGVLARMLDRPLRVALDRNVLPALRGCTQIDVRASEDVAFAKGAAALVLERLYRNVSA